eukprot:2905198-Rhodomonas_salina.2
MQSGPKPGNELYTHEPEYADYMRIEDLELSLLVLSTNELEEEAKSKPLTFLALSLSFPCNGVSNGSLRGCSDLRSKDPGFGTTKELVLGLSVADSLSASVSVSLPSTLYLSGKSEL